MTNTSRPLFEDANLLRALNCAVDRKHYVGVLGAFAVRPWSHILNARPGL